MRKLTKRATLLASSAVMALPAVVVSGGAAHADQPFPYVSVRIWGSTHCMDNAVQNAETVQMWNCTGVPEQKWQDRPNQATGTFALVNQNTNYCLDALAQGDGPVVMGPCTASNTQQWITLFADNPSPFTNGAYAVIENVASSQCLNTSSVANGTVLRTWPCDITAHYQKWHFDF
ncbi:Ricin B lectin [Catenulispora acidiphila DSM 44928]|uniref:Ricin B lectin n=1 Tax=Catenulispora acidiphila (strain DSM 44928 / JCM 14897 / NBRC 102108 / NRRL B-24433 / ID139908) TaxID=479433 RepID=C7Q502_CATAD|nr:ricin-type beta-trefoil lectin domain protein [Catenulispora acidiphila]ACU73950.1 Ricin B lectin [Catenulispora acidiphila DSM 44928]